MCDRSVPPFHYLVREAVFALPSTAYDILLKRRWQSDQYIAPNRRTVGPSEKRAASRTRSFTTGQLLNRKTLRWLGHMNLHGFDVFWRPAGPHIVIDLDSAAEDLWHTMIFDGLRVSLLTQTSASNYQAWITLAKGRKPIDTDLAVEAQSMLTHRYDGDKHAVGTGRFGRLPGYTNRKPENQREDGSWQVVGIRNGPLLRNQPIARVCYQTVEDAPDADRQEAGRTAALSPQAQRRGL